MLPKSPYMKVVECGIRMFGCMVMAIGLDDVGLPVQFLKTPQYKTVMAS